MSMSDTTFGKILSCQILLIINSWSQVRLLSILHLQTTVITAFFFVCMYVYIARCVLYLCIMFIADFSIRLTPLKDIPTTLKPRHFGNTGDDDIDDVICKCSIDRSDIFILNICRYTRSRLLPY